MLCLGAPCARTVPQRLLLSSRHQHQRHLRERRHLADQPAQHLSAARRRQPAARSVRDRRAHRHRGRAPEASSIFPVGGANAAGRRTGDSDIGIELDVQGLLQTGANLEARLRAANAVDAYGQTSPRTTAASRLWAMRCARPPRSAARAAPRPPAIIAPSLRPRCRPRCRPLPSRPPPRTPSSAAPASIRAACRPRRMRAYCSWRGCCCAKPSPE